MYSSTSDEISIRNIEPLKTENSFPRQKMCFSLKQVELHAETVDKTWKIELICTSISSSELHRILGQPTARGPCHCEVWGGLDVIPLQAESLFLQLEPLISRSQWISLTHIPRPTLSSINYRFINFKSQFHNSHGNPTVMAIECKQFPQQTRCVSIKAEGAVDFILLSFIDKS